MNILVDQLIEPIDIIWVNIGGDKGLYVFRRVFLWDLSVPLKKLINIKF